jgi:transglutaminase-like putative cysteine protease
MKRNSCYSAPSRPRSIRTALAAFAVLAGAVAWAEVSLRASTAPDWLRAAAQEKLPAYPSETVAVTLLDDEQTTVRENGEIETRHRHAWKLLRPEAKEEYGHVRVPFDNERKISFLRAWTITAQGTELELKDKEAVEISLVEFELYTDERAKVLEFPEAKPGAVVGYEYVQRHRPFVFEDDWEFQRPIPTLHARLSLQLPNGWEFTNAWANYPASKPQTQSANQYVWEVRDVPAIEPEPNMPAWHAVAGRMAVKYFPSDPNLRSKTTGTWNDLGAWYANLTVASRTPTAQIQQKVASLTAGAATPLARIKTLADYVQRQVRYVAIKIGIGGFQPHAAGDVFTHQYGDCKDKATLLSAMLRAAGIDSYYVLIDDERGEVSPEFPSLHFNHVILAIRLPDDIDASGLYATVRHPKFGRLLFFDPTNTYVPIGYLPSYLQDSFGLLVTENGGEILGLPLAPPTTNRLLRTAKFDLSDNGSLTGEVRELLWGGPAADSRQRLLEAPPAKRGKVLEDFVGNFLSNFALTNAQVGNLDQFNDSLLLNYKFTADGYAKSTGNLLIVRPRILGSRSLFIFTDEHGKPRKYPIEFDEATRQDDVFDITLPAGYVVDELPTPVEAHCDYATYKSAVEVKGNTLHYTRTYEIKDVYVPTSRLNEVQHFYQQVAMDERSSAVLRRVNP